MKTQSHFLQQSLIQQASAPSVASVDDCKTELPKLAERSFFSSIFFGYLYSFLSNASKRRAITEILPPLQDYENIQFSFTKLLKELKNTKQHHHDSKQDHKSLVKMLVGIFKVDIVKILILLIVVSALRMYVPYLSSQIIQFVSQRQSRQYWQGVILLGAIILVIFLKSVGEAQMNYRLSLLGINLSSNLSLLIYNKSLRHPLLRQKKFSSSDIINYSQVDSERMTNFGTQVSSLILTPIQLVVGIIMMWFFIGIAFVAGFLTTVLMIWINFMVSKLAVRFNGQVLKAKDSRMKVTQELLENIRFIKVNTLETHFLDRVNKEREIELRFIKKKALCEAVWYFLYWLTGPLILSVTFTTYILIGNQITPEAAFTTIMIFALIQSPIWQLPTAISEIRQIFTSLRRIQDFLNAKQIKENHIILEQLPYGDDAITINYGSFKWKQQTESKHKGDVPYTKVLKNINAKFKQHHLTMIFGEVGCGKSSLLLAILNQLKCGKHTNIAINGRLAYCSQNPWILSTSVRNNILLFGQYNQYKFKKAIYYSGLQKDLQLFPRGDLTEIGEKGMNISGGQKVRISLARAIYGNYDIYLFDDILSAVDVNLAEFIMKSTIKGYLKDKTVILVTNFIKYAKLADQIVLLKKGKIVMQDKSDNVITSKHFQALRRLQRQQRQVNVEESTIQQLRLIKLAALSKEKETCPSTSLKIVEQLMIPEDQQNGKIKLQVFKKYIDYNGGLFKFGFVVMLAIIIWMVLSTYASIFMSMWCQNPKDYSNGLIIYVALSLASSLFILIRASILILSSVKQGGTVHKLMINSLLKASLIKFYNRVPIGRILNRLTKDLKELDEAIGSAIGGLLVTFFQMLGTIAICVYSSTPYLLIPAVLLGYICWRVKNYYLNAQREVARLEKITYTPIVNAFVSTLRGLESVRAYQLSERFFRDQVRHINENKRIRTLKTGLESWFSLNLTYISFFVNILAMGFCILNEETSAAIAGLLLTYAPNLSSNINLTILCYAYFETKAVSLERIYEFTQIEPEDAAEESSDVRIEGKISFVNVSLRYREDLPNVLSDITLQILQGEKIGIAGKSGAGKSSLFNALLRIADISKGDLFIDGNQINKVDLSKLRKSITIIDQQAIILKGTIKENIDIFNQFTQAEVIETLKQCIMFDKIEKKGGLSFQISKQSLSSGEKQLICICRALLRQSPIVLIDEATASIDERNDESIQQVIRDNFKRSTVLTIAHRLETLSSSDRILIMDEGKVVEFGTPTQLRKAKGCYYEMLRLNSIDV